MEVSGTDLTEAKARVVHAFRFAVETTMRAGLADKGCARVIVTRRWDGFFEGHISTDTHKRTGEAITHYIRSPWASGEVGRRAITEKARTRLIELSRDLGVTSFNVLPAGYSRQGRRSENTQFGVCAVTGWRVATEGGYRAIAIKRRDNAT